MIFHSETSANCDASGALLLRFLAKRETLATAPSQILEKRVTLGPPYSEIVTTHCTLMILHLETIAKQDASEALPLRILAKRDRLHFMRIDRCKVPELPHFSWIHKRSISEVKECVFVKISECKVVNLLD